MCMYSNYVIKKMLTLLNSLEYRLWQLLKYERKMVHFTKISVIQTTYYILQYCHILSRKTFRHINHLCCMTHAYKIIRNARISKAIHLIFLQERRYWILLWLNRVWNLAISIILIFISRFLKHNYAWHLLCYCDK